MDERKEARKEASESKPKKPDWDQMDVLDEKNHVTSTGRGLQIWGDEGGVGTGVQAGDASQGTAQRSANISRAQEALSGDEDEEARDARRREEDVGRLHRPATDHLPPLSEQRPEEARGGDEGQDGDRA